MRSKDKTQLARILRADAEVRAARAARTSDGSGGREADRALIRAVAARPRHGQHDRPHAEEGAPRHRGQLARHGDAFQRSPVPP